MCRVRLFLFYMLFFPVHPLSLQAVRYEERQMSQTHGDVGRHLRGISFIHVSVETYRRTDT